MNGRVLYDYITDVTFGECICFEPSVYVCFLLMGHGSMNELLHGRKPSESARCVCGHDCEDWKYVLTDCSMYEYLRDLSECRVTVNDDGSMDVSGMLVCKATYQCFSAFARSLFGRRKVIVRVNVCMVC